MITPSPIIEIDQGLTIYRPLHVLPFHRFRIVQSINHWVATKLLLFFIARHEKWKKLPKIFWTFSLQRAIYPQWFDNTVFKVYDCVDMFMTGRAQDTAEWLRQEQRILKESDVVFTNSTVLYKRKKLEHPHVFLLPEGMFVPELFPVTIHNEEPTLMTGIPHPRVLFIGNINTRLDFSTIMHVASQLPRYSFIFVGKIDPLFSGPAGLSLQHKVNLWSRIPNIHVLPAVPKNEVASYMRFSDIGFIPYDIHQQFNKYCFPIKIMEYFSQGMPVVSSAIETVKALVPFSFIYNTRREAVSALTKAGSYPWPATYRTKQRRIALSNSVGRKLDEAEKILLRHFSRLF